MTATRSERSGMGAGTGAGAHPGGAAETEGRGLSVAAAVAQRRSVRAFLPDPVDPAVAERALRRAARAPSGSNMQPWSARIVPGARLDALLAMTAAQRAALPDGEPMDPPFLPAAGPPPEGRARKIRNGELLYGALGIDRSDAAARAAWNEENFRFFGAPLGVFLLIDRQANPWQWLDLGIYLQTVLLLLEEAGLATCPQADWAMHGEAVARHLGAPASRRLVCGIAVGHADPDAPENIYRSERDDPLSGDPDAGPPRPGDLA